MTDANQSKKWDDATNTAKDTTTKSDDAVTTDIVEEKKPLALIIEDDPDAAFISRRAMLDNNCDVKVIHRGDEAIDALATLRPDVILLDLHLPSISGLEILKHIRSDDDLRKTKVILVTADHATADTIALDADMVLLKPVMYTQVRDLVKRIMKMV